MAGLKVLKAGPAITLQDHGREGWLDVGLSRGGAADRLALAEAAALLDLPENAVTSLEMQGIGGTFEVMGDLQIALTGAPMQVTLDGAALAWNASHTVPQGSQLVIGSCLRGTYGYLTVAAVLEAPMQLGGHAAHLAASIGAPLQAGATLALSSRTGRSGYRIAPTPRFEGGEVRMVASFHTPLFGDALLARFQDTHFARGMRGNRMGVQLDAAGPGFQPEGGRNIVSEVVLPGDIQVTGDGTPFVLMAESQTTGGYPRIGTVLPCDLPKVAQATPGKPLRFRMVSLQDAVAAERSHRTQIKALAGSAEPLIRDPKDIADLLSYQLISGMVTGTEED